MPNDERMSAEQREAIREGLSLALSLRVGDVRPARASIAAYDSVVDVASRLLREVDALTAELEKVHTAARVTCTHINYRPDGAPQSRWTVCLDCGARWRA